MVEQISKWERTGKCPMHSRAAPGKSGLHARGEGERVLALKSREGTIKYLFDKLTRSWKMEKGYTVNIM